MKLRFQACPDLYINNLAAIACVDLALIFLPLWGVELGGHLMTFTCQLCPEMHESGEC